MFYQMKILAIIPARYSSTRLPGKPLKIICGRHMYEWVYLLAKSVNRISDIIIATDHQLILENCMQNGIPVMLTSTTCATGTDRVAEVAKTVNADIYITLQGDEPLMEPQNVELLIDKMLSSDKIFCATLMTKFINPVDVVNATTPKVVSDINKNILMMSRSPIPYPKASLDYNYYKALGVYGFRRKALLDYGRWQRTPLEIIEDIELLRFVEHGVKIKIVETFSESVAVDTLKDLQRVRSIMQNRLNIKP